MTAVLRRCVAALVVVVVAAAALAAPASAQEPVPVPDDCPLDPAPCVYVTPDPADGVEPGEIFVFHGRGWPPGAGVLASYGSYCPSTADVCLGVGLSSLFRADANGRFTFSFRNGRRPTRAMPPPRGAGGEAESMRFASSAVDEPGEGGRDAIPPPRPSTPEQRAEAARIGAAVDRAAQALATRDDAVSRSLDRYQRDLDSCRRLRNRFRYGTRRARVVNALIALAFDRAMLEPVRSQLRAFVDDLQRAAPADPELVAGVQGWAAAVQTDPPWPRPSMCGAMRRWRAAGFALSRAPADPRTAGRREMAYRITHDQAIGAAAKRLRELAAGRAAQERFDGDLIDLAFLLGDNI